MAPIYSRDLMNDMSMLQNVNGRFNEWANFIPNRPMRYRRAANMSLFGMFCAMSRKVNVDNVNDVDDVDDAGAVWFRTTHDMEMNVQLGAALRDTTHPSESLFWDAWIALWRGAGRGSWLMYSGFTNPKRHINFQPPWDKPWLQDDMMPPFVTADNDDTDVAWLYSHRHSMRRQLLSLLHDKKWFTPQDTLQPIWPHHSDEYNSAPDWTSRDCVNHPSLIVSHYDACNRNGSMRYDPTLYAQRVVVQRASSLWIFYGPSWECDSRRRELLHHTDSWSVSIPVPTTLAHVTRWCQVWTTWKKMMTVAMANNSTLLCLDARYWYSPSSENRILIDSLRPYDVVVLIPWS